MDKLSRQGHRQRIRSAYRSGGADSMPDHNLLELMISLIIPQKDVKPIAYELINYFGSLQNVLDASVEELMEVSGVGECVAVGISLIKDINKRALQNKNENIKTITSSKDAIKYFKNILALQENERIVLITLDNSSNIISCHTVGQGSVSSANLNSRQMAQIVLRDNAVSVIVAHNHPNGNADASVGDINFTLELRNLLDKINISLLDHIIIGKSDAISMKSNPKWALYFDFQNNSKSVASSRSEYVKKMYEKLK